MNTTLRKALRTEYVLLRTPLAVLDERVLTRLDERSPLRVAVERGLSVLDGAAARVLAEPPTSGAKPPTPGGGPAEPEQLPAQEVSELAEELLAEQEEEHNLAGELADDEELRRVQAELKAKHHVEQEREAGRD